MYRFSLKHMHMHKEWGYALYRVVVVKVLGLPLESCRGVASDFKCCHGDTNFILQLL